MSHLKEILGGYFELTKPRITLFVLIITTLGYYLGGQGFGLYSNLFFLLLGSGLVCAGASTINHYLERDLDSRMVRTKNRPIPTGLISPAKALGFGVVSSLLGIFILYVKTNVITAFLALLTVFLYIMVYTPLKRTSWLNTSVGAIPGALPTLGGWAAATGGLEFKAGILFLILFVWQHPHFYAIAWMCKDDYRRGGFQMLPCIEESGERTFKQIIYFCILLIPLSLIPAFIGMSGAVYFFGTLLAGLGVFLIGYQFTQSKTNADARRLLRATVYYLPILLILMVADSKF